MATITVTNNNDSGPGSLRQAIADAMPGDTINFAPAVSLITLTSGGLLIDKNLTIAGPGAKVLTISGNNSIRVFIILSGVKGTIQGISITNGIAREGGAIYNYGTATLTNCNLSNNTATLDGGGAIWNVVTGTVTLTNCTLSNNSSADTGGAIVNLGTATLTNCTLSNNNADFIGGAIGNFGTATLTNCTLSNNNATSFGGAIYNDGSLGISFNTIANNHSRRDAVIANDVRGSISFKNSIVANDSHNYFGPGTMVASGVNFATDDTLPGFTQVTPAALKLGPLALNPPGNTETHALLKGSAAIDAVIDCTDLKGNPVTTDQRGVTRPQGRACDAGAYEFEVKMIPVVIAQPLRTNSISLENCKLL